MIPADGFAKMDHFSYSNVNPLVFYTWVEDVFLVKIHYQSFHRWATLAACYDADALWTSVGKHMKEKNKKAMEVERKLSEPK